MKILILTNSDAGLYKFRRELLEQLVKKYQVYICLPDGIFTEELRALGCRYIACDKLERHGTSPAKEIRLLWFYWLLLKKLRPDVVLTYTIKPNIYGGMVCSRMGIPYLANITGLGTALEHAGMMRRILLILYKAGLKSAWKVFFQNRENLEFMRKKGMIAGKYALLPGSGVNLEDYTCMEYPQTDEPVVFLTIGRLMRDKGTDEILWAAKVIRKRHKQAVFRMIGDCDENGYKEKIRAAAEAGIIEHVENQPDVKPYIRDCHALLHASYHEGMSNVLLEAAACGRPVIATDVPGCIETFEPGVSGIAFRARSVESLVDAIEQFLSLSSEKRREMGQQARRRAETHFDRRIVVDAYRKEIAEIRKKQKCRKHKMVDKNVSGLI